LSFLLCLCAGNAVLLIEPAAAQTEWKDRPVTLAPGDQTGHSIARPARSAYTVVVWEDKRRGEYDIYAQMIDSATGLPVWGDVDGMPAPAPFIRTRSTTGE
jgi:hypothetical protein